MCLNTLFGPELPGKHSKKENTIWYTFQGILIMILFEVYYIKDICHWGSSVGNLEVHNGYIPLNSLQQMNREFLILVWKEAFNKSQKHNTINLKITGGNSVRAKYMWPKDDIS